MQIIASQAPQRRLRRVVEATEGLVQAIRRKIRRGAQGLQPDDDLVERPEGVVGWNFLDDAAQFAGIGQWMLRGFRADPGQATQFFEHPVFPFGLACQQPAV